jgi:hypothetical protein
MKETSDLHDPSVIDAEHELAASVGLPHAVAAAQQQLVSWEELPDGSIEAMADRQTFERASVAHSLAAAALLGDDITAELSHFGPLTQAQACLEALERASQCVFLDETGRAAMLAERVVDALANADKVVLPAVLLPSAALDGTDDSGLPGAVLEPGALEGEQRFVLRLLAAKLTASINPDDGDTLRAWMADVAQLMGTGNAPVYSDCAIRLFVAMRVVYGMHRGESLVEVAADLAATADRLPSLRKRTADGEWVQD